MPKSVELGRAVLYSPLTNLDVWLTTSLTISLEQGTVSIEKLKHTQILDLLSSGDTWVERGPGMHAELRITTQDEPLPERQIRTLVESIIQAPVWEQLMLRTSMLDDSVSEAGTVRWNIQRADHWAQPKEQQRYRKSLIKLSDTEVRPPNGISVVALHSVQFSMSIMESRQRTTSINKRKRTTLQGFQSSQAETMPIEDDQTEKSGVVLYSTGLSTDKPHTLHVTSTATLESQKRKRSKTHSDDNRDALRSCPVTISTLQPRGVPSFAELDQAEIERLVDGALRLSVSGSFKNRPVHGLKVKANTFFLGLADVCPVLWKPGYLHTLLERAHLLSHITRSLSQVAFVKATSSSLKNKLVVATANLHNELVEDSLLKESYTDEDVRRIMSTISSRLWRHLGTSLLSKSTIQLESFVTLDSQVLACSHSDNLFGEARQCQERSCTTNLQTGDDEDTDSLDEQSMLHDVCRL